MTGRRALLAQAAVLAAVAAAIGRLATTGTYAAYVRPGMRLPLLASAAVLFVLAASKAWAAGDRRPDHDPTNDEDAASDHHDHDHDHARFPRIGAWLLVPIACLAAIPILPLGSGAVSERRANVVVARTAADARATPPPQLAEGEVTLLDFMTRVVTLPDQPFTEPVTVTGFVASRSPSAGEFVLGRFVMSCCAADAQPVLITVRTDGPLPRKDAWVRVTGTQVPAAVDLTDAERAEPSNIVLEASDVEPVEQPDQPYLVA